MRWAAVGRTAGAYAPRYERQRTRSVAAATVGRRRPQIIFSKRALHTNKLITFALVILTAKHQS